MKIENPKKRDGKYCNGIRTTWPGKGLPCCATPVVIGDNGLWYCRNHVHQGALEIEVNDR